MYVVVYTQLMYLKNISCQATVPFLTCKKAVLKYSITKSNPLFLNQTCPYIFFFNSELLQPALVSNKTKPLLLEGKEYFVQQGFVNSSYRISCFVIM